MFLTFNPGKGGLGAPYDSTQGTPEEIMLPIFIGFVLFSLYTGIKVWRMIKEEERNKNL